MQNGQFQQIITGADKHHHQLVKSLETDSDFAKSADRLAALEAKEGEFDHVRYITQIRPWIPIVDVLDGIQAYASDYNKYRNKQEMTEHRNFLAITIRNNLVKQQPKFDEMTIEQAMSYRLFLGNLSTNYLADNQHLHKTLKDLEGKIQVAIETKAKAQAKTEMLAEFTKLAKSNHEVHEKLKALDQDITRGQRLLQETLDKMHTHAENNNAKQQQQIAEVINKLKGLGIPISVDLKRMVENSHEVRTKITEMHGYLKAQAARQAREDKDRQTQANFQGVADTFGFIGALGNHLKSKELQQIGVIGVAFTKITESIMALKGLESFSLAALNPMMAIGMAGLSIIGVLANDDGPNPNQLILDAIRGLSEQVHNLRIEMHERFDRLEQMLGKIMTKMIEEFCQLRAGNLQIKQAIDALKEGQGNIQATINTVHTKLQTFIDNQFRMGRREKLETIHVDLNRVTSDYSLDVNEFKQAFDQLHVQIRDLQCTPILVGQYESPATMLKCLENDSCNEFFAEFNIALLCQHASEMTRGVIPNRTLVNPILWVWQSLGFMYLARRRYPQDAKAADPISESEFNKLNEVVTKGEELEQFILSLQNGALLQVSHRKFEQAAKQLQTEFDKYIRQEEQKTANQLSARWQTLIDASKETKLGLFRQQEIHTTDDIAGKDWFKGYDTIRPIPPFRREERPAYGDRNTDYIRNEIKKYQDERQKSINAAKEKHLLRLQPVLNAISSEIPLRSCQFCFFAEPRVEEHSYFGFIYPEDRSHPILPMAAGYRPYIPNIVYQAEWLGLGQIIIKYRIYENQFILTANFVMPDQSLQIGPELRKPYSPGIYYGNEAIWWFGVGGNYSVTGDANKTLVREHVEHGNPYVTYVYLPDCNEMKGLADTLTYHPGSQEIKGIEQLNAKVLEKQRQLSSEISTNLKDLLQKNEQHPLTVAMINYSNSFYLLRAVVTLGFHDEVMASPQWKYFSPELRHLPNFGEWSDTVPEEKGGHPPQALSDIAALRNRDDFICFMRTNQNTSPMQFFAGNLAYIQRQLKTDIEMLAKRQPSCQVDYKLLSDALGEFKKLLAHYQRTKVRQNQLTEEINNPVESQQLRAYRDLMRALGGVISQHMTPELQRDLRRLDLTLLGIQTLAAPTEDMAAGRQTRTNLIHVRSGNSNGSGGSAVLETTSRYTQASLIAFANPVMSSAGPAPKYESQIEEIDEEEVLVDSPKDDSRAPQDHSQNKLGLGS